MDKRYILDTNIFITAKNKWYPFDIFPSFWEQLLQQAQNTTFYMTDEIFDELLSGDDQLSEWFTNNKNSFSFLESADPNLISIYSDIIQNIVDNTTYRESAKEEFAQVADSWIIAHAKANNLIIVTQETQIDINCKKRVKIPNVCLEFEIECIDIIEFMRRTNFRF